MAAREVKTPTQAIAEFVKRRAAELRDRKEAEKKANNIFLAPEDVIGGYEKTRKLLTTLGGNGRRTITEDDLRQFQATARKLGNTFHGGITAQQVIDRSLESRRASARAEIHYAVPMQSKGSRFHFVTNSGPDSKHKRHHVYVDFREFPSSVAKSEKVSTLARRVAAGHLAFDCDCEDTRYRFRYIATVGGFNAGRPETGFPKLTNAELNGVACKHVLRVMRSLTSSPVQTRIARALEAMRNSIDDKPLKVTKSEAEQIALHQQRQRGRGASTIETTAEKTARLASTPAAKNRAMAAAMKEAQRRAAVVADLRASTMAALRAIDSLPGLSKKMKESFKNQAMKQSGLKV